MIDKLAVVLLLVVVLVVIMYTWSNMPNVKDEDEEITQDNQERKHINMEEVWNYRNYIDEPTVSEKPDSLEINLTC